MVEQSRRIADSRRIGRYEVGPEIGRGRKLIVHTGRVHGVEGFVRDVAIKLVDPREDPRIVIAGARRAIGLSHASVLQLVDLGAGPLREPEDAEDVAAAREDVTYLVTELARGPSLRDILATLRREEARATGLGVGAALSVVAEVTRALDYVHRKRLVHGALHTGQIFVTAEGQVKVSDFCLGDPEATARDDLQAIGTLIEDLLDGIGPGAAAPPHASIQSLLEALRTPTLDAGSLHEQLLELAYELAPDAFDRDPGAFARALERIDEAIVLTSPTPAPVQLVTPAPPAATDAPVDTTELFWIAVRAREPHVIVFESGEPHATNDPLLSLVSFGNASSDEEIWDERRVASIALSLAKRASPIETILVSRGRIAEALPALEKVQANTARKVAVSRDLATRLRGSFLLEDAADHAWIAGEKASAPRGRFVGRGPELRALGLAIQRAHDEGATMLVLHGPPGIGKTRLVQELARRVPSGRVSFVFVDCSDSAARVPLGTIGLLVRTLLGLGRNIDASEIVPMLRSAGLDPSEIASLCRTINIAFEMEEEEPRRLGAHEALGRLLGAARAGKPLVVVLDNASDLDPASFSVLCAVASEGDAGKRLPVLFILAQRAAERPSVERSMDLALAELDDDAVAQLLTSQLGARILPPDLFELVVERAGGHPLFLEDTVRDLVDAALVRVQGGVAELAASARENPPEGFFDGPRAMCAARVARLPALCRTLLALTSLHRADGIVPAALARALSTPIVEVEQALGTIEDRGLGRRDERGALFTARPYAEAALVRLTDEERRALHEGLARAFAEDAGDDATAWSQVGDDFAAADKPMEAAVAWTQAAQRFDGSHQAAAAVDALARALPSLVDPALAAEAVRILARRLPEAIDLPSLDLAEGLGRALMLADSSLVEDEPVTIRTRLALAFGARGDREMAEVLLDQAAQMAHSELTVLAARFALAARTRDRDLAHSALEALGSERALSLEVSLDAAAAALAVADVPRAKSLLEAHASRLESEDTAATVRAELALLRGEMAALEGRADLALASYERALAIGRASRPSIHAARAALLLAERGASGAELALLREAADLAREASDASTADLALARLAWIERGELARSEIERRARRAEASGRLLDAQAIERIPELAQRR